MFKNSQFIHIDAHSRVIPKKSKQWSAFAILKEACREVGYVGHINHPQAPDVLFGDHPLLLVDDLKALKDYKTESGRRLRKDAKCLLSGVASFPIPLDKMTVSDERLYEGWKIASLGFLHRQFGQTLKSVVIHQDESFPHLHFYCLPFNEGMKMDDIHPGMRARKNVKGGKHAKEAALVQGMVKFQDDYHTEVSSHFKHARISDDPRARQKYGFWQRMNELSKTTNSLKKIIKIITEENLEWTNFKQIVRKTLMIK